MTDEREFHRLEERVKKLEKRLCLVEIILADLPTPTLRALAQAFLDYQANSKEQPDD